MPIVLGDSYKGIFKLNDIIETKYIKCKVVAFLEQNQFYLDKGVYDPERAKSLNTFIIMPSPIDVVDSNLNNALLLIDNKKDVDFYKVQKDIDELANKNGVKLSISNPKENIDDFVELMNYNANIKRIIVYIIIFFVIVSLLAIFQSDKYAKKRIFSAYNAWSNI